MYYTSQNCHNPYFSRWFSAIRLHTRAEYTVGKVTILILVDGFLQYIPKKSKRTKENVTILILVDGFLQYNIHIFVYTFRGNVTILILVDGFLQW